MMFNFILKKRIHLYLILFFIFLVGCNPQSNAPEKIEKKEVLSEFKDSTLEITPTTVPTQQTFGVGDNVKVDNFVFTVNEVKTSQGGDFLKPKSGYVYFIPNVTIENLTTEKVSVSTVLQVYLKDSEGNKYTPTIGSDSSNMVDGDLMSMDKIKGNITFEVPQKSEGFKLYYEPSLFSKNTVVVEL